jgi:hypothetical protein
MGVITMMNFISASPWPARGVSEVQLKTLFISVDVSCSLLVAFAQWRREIYHVEVVMN